MIGFLCYIPDKILVEKEMATHSSILAWSIPWTEEPGGLKSMGLQKVGYAGTTHRQDSWSQKVAFL